MPKFNQIKIDKLKRIDNFFKLIYLFPKNKKHYPLIKDSVVNEIIIIGFLLIGDTIMYLPALKTVKKNFPNAKITLVCEKVTELILKNQNVIDKFVLVDCPWIVKFNYSIKNIFSFFSSLRLINKINYDLAIEFRGDWRNIFFMNFIKAKRKVSYNFSGGEYMLTDSFGIDEKAVQFTDEAFALLKQMGLTFDQHDKAPRLMLSDADSYYLNKFKAENNLIAKTLIGVHPGTSQEVKRWAESKYSEAIIKLSKTYKDLVFLIFEGPGEANTVACIKNVLDTVNVNYLIISKSLKEYILLISICLLMICNDSGAAHIAAAHGISVVIVFGNVDPIYVTPYGAKYINVVSHDMACKPCYQSVCKFRHNNCINDVAVNEVFFSAVNILNNYGL